MNPLPIRPSFQHCFQGREEGKKGPPQPSSFHKTKFCSASQGEMEKIWVNPDYE